MIGLGLILLIIGLLVMYLVPEPTISTLGKVTAIIGGVLLILGVVLLALDVAVDLDTDRDRD